ncbi:MAG TPA: hypothetical protein VKT33_11535 [Candidatus Angelobacter sp.]|nr:hypothetical protein [Candidatus Angelobacter sp.]
MSLIFSNDRCSAFLVEIIRAFEQYHKKHYLGRTALQKLAYFSKALGVPIPCAFEIYNFGPYSDTITFTVESMIADDIIEDASTNPKYSNYRLKSHSPSFDKDIKKSIIPYKQQIEMVVKTLGKFEPSQLELLATLHFIAKKINSLGGTVTKDAVIKDFFKVKGDKFDKGDVSSWYDALKDADLI